MLERFLYYWAKMYTANLKIGDNYNKLRKTISIIIIDSEIPKFKELKKSHTKWLIKEDENEKIILTSYLELHIIELPKAIKEYKNNLQDEVLQWMMFLENPKDVEVTEIMKENEDIKEAKEELDKISQDDILRRMALKAELQRRDIGQIKYDAEQRGKKEGTKETKEEIVKKLYEINMTIEQIAQVGQLENIEVKKILEIED